LIVRMFFRLPTREMRVALCVSVALTVVALAAGAPTDVKANTQDGTTIQPVLTPQAANLGVQTSGKEVNDKRSAHNAAVEAAHQAAKAHDALRDATNRAYTARRDANLKYRNARQTRIAAQGDVTKAQTTLYAFASTTFRNAKAALDALNLEKPKQDALAAQRAQAAGDLPHFPDPAKSVADKSLSAIKQDLDAWYEKYRNTGSSYVAALNQVNVLRTAVKSAQDVVNTDQAAEDQANTAFLTTKKFHEDEQTKLKQASDAHIAADATVGRTRLGLIEAGHKHKSALRARLIAYKAAYERAHSQQTSAELDMEGHVKKRHAQISVVNGLHARVAEWNAALTKADGDVKAAHAAHAAAVQADTNAKQATLTAQARWGQMTNALGDFTKRNPPPT